MAELNSQGWCRSRRCDTKDCVEVAFDPDRDRVYLRNSSAPGQYLELSLQAWRAFRQAIIAGELDRPSGADAAGQPASGAG